MRPHRHRSKDASVAELAGAHFHSLVEAVPDGAVVVDEAGTLRLVNRQIEALFGYPRHELLGQPVEMLLPERFHQVHAADRERYVTTPRSRPMGVGLELFGRRKDGSEFPVEVSLSPLRAANRFYVLGVVRDVSERKQGEEQLHGLLDTAHAAEVRFRGLLESAPVAMVIAGRDGRITLVNGQTEALFGYSRDELLGQPVEILIPHRFHGTHPGHRERYTANPHTRPMGVGLELFGRRKDGTEFPVEVSLSTLQGPEGTQVLSAIRDVTERKQAEAALRRAEQEATRRAGEMRAMFEAMADGVVVFDASGRVQQMNAAARTFFATGTNESVPLDESAAMGALRTEQGGALTHDAWPSRLLLQGQVLRGMSASDFELRTQDGRRLLLNLRGAPMTDQNGQISGAVAIFRDVTQRRQFEQRAREEAEARLTLLRTVVDELPSAVYLVRGRDARMVLANRAAVDVWGAEWPQGQPMTEFLATSQTRVFAADGLLLPDEQLATLRAVRTGEAVRHHQEIIRHPDGAALPVLLNAVALDARVLEHLAAGSSDAGGEAPEPLALVVLQDVTPLKEAEQLKDEFISIAAHELRNPMAALKGFTEMLSVQTARGKGPALADWQMEAVEAIDQAAVRLIDLTEDLLDVTRLQAGRLALRMAPVDLVALARRVASRVQVTTARHVLKVSSPCEHVVASVDAQRVEQVLTNLMSNAIKYSPEGGDVDIVVDKHAGGGAANISVRDRGIGIPAGQQARIFGRFVRADNARDQGIRGTGLGLYLSRELVERHGGQIWFESAEGEGSTFYVSLPLVEDDPSVHADAADDGQERSA